MEAGFDTELRWILSSASFLDNNCRKPLKRAQKAMVLHPATHRDFEPRQGEPAQTTRDYYLDDQLTY